MSPKAPHVWGPSFWHVMHQAALGYPNEPTTDQRVQYGGFFAALGEVLPCVECSARLHQHASEVPIAGYLDSRSTLFEWTVLIHNRVNRAARREEWSLSRAWTEHAAPPVPCGACAPASRDPAEL